MCPECIKADYERKTDKLEALKPKFREQAKAKGLEEFAIVATVNDNPGFRWVEIGDEAVGRLGAVMYCVVY